MNKSFRTCRIDDAKQICGLVCEELGYTDKTTDEIRAALQKIIDDDNYFTLVVEGDGEILGFISAVREVSFEMGEYYRVIAFAVRQKCQGQGLGTALITLVEAKARTDGAELITLSSNFKRTEAHEFYEKLGYIKTSFAFKKKLG